MPYRRYINIFNLNFIHTFIIDRRYYRIDHLSFIKSPAYRKGIHYPFYKDNRSIMGYNTSQPPFLATFINTNAFILPPNFFPPLF